MFKIRCSAISQIMANSRTKGETLGETAKTYCELWKKEQVYNRRKEITSKFLTKGTLQEQDSIDLLNGYELELYEKNETRYEDDYMVGTPDIVTDIITDIKTSWDFSTFPLFKKELDKNYFYQVQGYMNLTGLEKARVVYALVDTPKFLIEQEAKRMVFNQGYDFDDVYTELLQKMTYPDIPIDKKIKIFQVDRCEETIQKIKDRVIECRIYIDSL
jgi:hypothetical protein